MDISLLGIMVLYVGALIYSALGIRDQQQTREHLAYVRKRLDEESEEVVANAQLLINAKKEFEKLQEAREEQFLAAFKATTEHQAKSDDEWVVVHQKPKKKRAKR